MISTGSTFNTFNMVKRNTFYKECMEREEEEEEEERKITGSSRLRRPPVAGGCGCCRRRWRQLGEVEQEVPCNISPWTTAAAPREGHITSSSSCSPRRHDCTAAQPSAAAQFSRTQ
jgi:hypothetical protein